MAFGSNKEEGKKNGIGVYIALAFVAVAFLAGIFGSINVFIQKTKPVAISGEAFPMLSKGDYVEGRINLASKEIFTLKHSINFIPAGTEHYFVIVDDNYETCIAVRASEKWVSNFSANEAIDPAGQFISGYVRRTDYKVQSSLADFRAEGFNINTGIYIDLLGTRYAGLTLLGCALLALTVLYGALLVKYTNGPYNPGFMPSAVGEALRNLTANKAVSIVMLVVFMGSLGLLIHVMEML